MTNRLLHRTILLLAALVPAACATSDGAATAPLDLPPNAAPHPAVAPLAFLSGRWVCVNPNDTVNEEHWMPPRGRFLLGAFRQVRLDGKCSFVELTQIALEDDEIVLRLRHLHGQLEVPEKRQAADVFKLTSLTANRVEFAGSGDAEGVTAVVYELRGPDELVQSIRFDPAKTTQPPFVSTYRRARD